MRVLEVIPSFDEKRLADLEANARRQADAGTDEQKVQAECVLLAIAVERTRRRVEEGDRRRRLTVSAAEKVKDRDLFDRVLIAFSDMPPEQWEAEVLKEIAARPGQHFDKIAHAIGKRGGGYVNLAVGTLCSSREAYLGSAPAAQKKRGEKVFSALLIDFTNHTEPDGSQWHGWTLKPEAAAALRQLDIVR